MSRRVDDILEEARTRIGRVDPADLDQVVTTGGLVVDIRPESQRHDVGALPGAVVIERNVLEWRLDPRSEHRIREVRDHDQQVVVVCSAGYASSLAAASLVDLGFTRAADLEGGYLAWRAWSGRRTTHSGPRR